MPFLEVPDYEQFEGLKNNKRFKALMDELIELRQDVDILENRIEEVKKEVEPELVSAGVGESVSYRKWQVRVVDTEGRPKVNMKKLLRLLGPDGPTLVKQAMTPGVPMHYVRLTSPKENKE